ncbi:MAG: DinB family protein [Sphingobacteriales bacterium]|nr:MAG: DinB family protein [Sphingobacteriales bacterium]
MPSFNNRNLIQSLERDVQKLLNEIKGLQGLSQETLNRQPQPGKWSAVQVLEHLNSYNRHYLPVFESTIKKADEPQAPGGMHNLMVALKLAKKGEARRPMARQANRTFNAGVLGNYYTNMMMPKEGKVAKKLPADQKHTPARILDAQKVVAEFIESQTRLIEVMKAAETVDLQKLKVGTTLPMASKLRMGDMFRFLVAHQQRHFVQLAVAMKQVKATETLLQLVA